MIIVPAVEFMARLAPKTPILCAVTTTTEMLCKEHLSKDSNSFGIALSDPNWKYSHKFDATTDVNDVDRAVSNHKVGGVVFSLPLKESIKQWTDVYGYRDEGPEMQEVQWQRTCLLEFLHIFPKNSKVLACFKATKPDLDNACQLAQAGKEPYVGELDYLHSRRKPHMLSDDEFTLATDARIALNEFLAEYAGRSMPFPKSTNTDEKETIQDSEFH